MRTDEVAGKIDAALEGMDVDFEAVTSHGDTQSELVEKDTYESHIQGLRPGAGQEILARVERARDRARTIVAQEIRSAGEVGLHRRERAGAGRAAAARRNDAEAGAIQRSTPREERQRDQGGLGNDDGGAARQAVRRPDVDERENGRKFTGFFSSTSMGFKGI